MVNVLLAYVLTMPFIIVEYIPIYKVMFTIKQCAMSSSSSIIHHVFTESLESIIVSCA